MRRDYQVVNPTLRRVARAIYQQRRPLPANQHTFLRPETVDGRTYYDMWFRTGCRHDLAGGCTMCNYGKGKRTGDVELLTELDDKLSHVSLHGAEVTISPSGSFLDEREVSPMLRHGVLRLLADRGCSLITIETRADTVERRLLEEVADALRGTPVCVELGLEALDDWVLRNCINKGITVQSVADAIPAIHASGMRAIGNIGVGIPFLSEHANLSLATDSVLRAEELGLDRTTLFPYHVKPGTVVGVLFEGGHYHCVSLWTLIDVLARISRTTAPLPQISWYRNYYADPSKILASPTTCQVCIGDVLEGLDLYRHEPSKARLDYLTGMTCPCRRRWKENMEAQPDGIRVKHVTAQLRWLATHLGLPSERVEEEERYMEASLERP